MIYEDFRSHVIIDAAQFFMKDLYTEIKAKELQLKKIEEEKGEVSQKQLNERKTLEEKLKSKAAENAHLKASLDEQTEGI